MKFGGLLLALLVIFLGSVPCCTFEECDEAAEAKHIQHEVPVNEKGSCSPFLKCGGCTGFTIQDIAEDTAGEIKNLSAKSIFHHRQSIPGNIIQTIWQPPQLS